MKGDRATMESSRSNVAGTVDVLSRKARKHLYKHLGEGEEVKLCIQGANSQAIVALQERLLVIKPGWEAAATFGARVTSFYYHDITGIEVNTGLLLGVIEINTPAYQGTATKDYWSTAKDRDPRRLSNCIPIAKRHLAEYKPYIAELERLVREAKQGHRAPSSPTSDSGGIGAELERIAELRTSGALTEEEFQQAKRRILD
jgi:hypothetical protein